MPPIDRRFRRLGLAVLLAWGLGAVLASMGQATEPFPTHAPLSRSVPGAQNLGTGLASGQQLNANQYVLSGNGQYELDMFADGVGVLWNMPAGASACAMWIFPGISNSLMSDYPWSPAVTPVPGSYLIMQEDGNFVQYYPPPGGTAIWASGTNGNSGATLTLQDDGNLVVYQGSNALWATSTNNYRGAVLCKGNTLQPNQGLVQSTYMNDPFAVNNANSPDAPFHLLVSTGGELELLSNGFPDKLCCKNKDTVPGSYLIMQDDGNLVFSDPQGNPLWASGTSGHPGAVAMMSNWSGVWVVDPVSGLILYDTEGLYQGQVVGQTSVSYPCLIITAGCL